MGLFTMLGPIYSQGESAGDHGQWESGAAPWLYTATEIGPWLLLLVFVGLLVRAFVHRHRYHAGDLLGPEGEARVHAALQAAERRTVGEILPVVVERSDPHPGAKWLSAAAATVLGSLLCAGFLPWHLPPVILATQTGFAGLGWLAARFLPAYQRLFVPEERATAVAEEQAFQEFYRSGLHRTEAATGVLLFVSLLERRVVVLADEGIASKVEEDTWTAVDSAVLGGVAAGKLADGIVAGIEACGAVLEEHFPWAEGDRNEIPDRLIVRRE